MSVRDGLLAILREGPCYGYQLRAEYRWRTGERRSLNVGQVYNTLDRLERDGLVEQDIVDQHGHVYYGITIAGAHRMDEWWADTSTTGGALVDKILLGLTLPHVDSIAVVRAHRDAVSADQRGRGTAGAGVAETVRELALAADRGQAAAQREWLDSIAMLLESGSGPVPQGLSTATPKRGRPRRVPERAAEVAAP